MRSLTILLLLVPVLQAKAEVPNVNLKVRYSRNADTFTATLKPNSSAAACRYDLYASTSRERLEKNAARGSLIFSTNGAVSTSSVSAGQVSEAKVTKGKSKPVFFRARIKCGNESGFSSISRVALRENASGVSIANWLSNIRSRLLIASSSVTRAFPSLSFEAPVDLQTPPDGSNRLFVVEQRGTIQVFSNSSSTTTKSVFLDISSKLVFVDEQGLLGLAFHPNYSSNGFFYVNYTRSGDGATVIERYKAGTDPSQADPASGTTILTVEQPFANHNGGALTFGADGFLYIALGDGGSGGDPQGNGQKTSTLLGKILRIDVDRTSALGNYAIPSDNPFAGNTSGIREEIFALGLRNPWRISFDTQTGLLWCGDVGQGEREEVDIITSGANYGWNVLEGSACFESSNCNKSAFTAPIAEYTHAVGESITGGYVYRGESSPNLEGYYIYADFISGRIFALERVNGKAVVSELLDSSINVSSFGVDSQGELYMLSYSDGLLYSVTQQ